MTTETNKTFEITSTISITPKPKSIIVCFRVCDGDKEFLPNFHSLIDFYSSRNCLVLLDDTEGNPLPDEECAVVDSVGNNILEGRKNVDSPVGILVWDEDYLTDEAKYLEDCTKEEMELVMESYRNQEIEDEELSDLIHSSLVNHKPIKTLEELADYWNSCNDCPFDFPDVIEKNGWHEPDDIPELELTICFDDEGNRVELNENGDAEVIYA